MNKNDLVNKVSDGTGLSKTDSAKAVDSVLGNPSEWPVPSLDMLVSDITLQEDIAGKVAATPEEYDITERDIYRKLAAMRGKIVNKVSSQLTSSSQSDKKTDGGSLRRKKKRKSTKRRKATKRRSIKRKSIKRKSTKRKLNKKTRRRRY